jgi:hypothetical protein
VRTLILVTIALTLCQCTKVRDVANTVTYTLHNQTGQRVIIDHYPSRQDYKDMTNRLGRDTVEAKASIRLPLHIGTTVWIDWYTTDFSMHNWTADRAMEGAPAIAAQFKVTAEDQNIALRSIVPDTRDTSRSIFLNGMHLSSTWQLTSLPNDHRPGNHTFIFARDFTGLHTYTDTTGHREEAPFYYYAERFDGTKSPNFAFILKSSQTQTGGIDLEMMRLWFNPMNSTRDSLPCYLVQEQLNTYRLYYMQRK